MWLDRHSIYKVENTDEKNEPIELVKIVEIKPDRIKVISIKDDYEFEYDLDYFKKYATIHKEV